MKGVGSYKSEIMLYEELQLSSCLTNMNGATQASTVLDRSREVMMMIMSAGTVHQSAL